MFELIDEVPCANVLGEGVQWNHRDQSVWWTDIKSSKLYRYHLASKALKAWDMPEFLGCFAFVEDDERMLLALASGFAWFAPNTGAIEWIAKTEAHWVGNRLNDGRVDRQGRFWVGSIMEEQNAPDQSASLFCLDHAQQVSTHLTGLRISNSLCWSQDSSRLYHADSPTHQIKVYKFEPATGSLGEGRVFVRAGDKVEPDGACIDAEDHLWSAEWGGQRVVRYNPDGEEVAVLPMPVSQPTCMALGGDDMNLLFVTSARLGLSNQALTEQPRAGNLFIYRTAFRGLNECWYKASPAR